MATRALLDELTGKLGYRNTRGFVDDAVEAGNRGLVWEDLRDKCGADAAYFKGAVPIIAFVAAENRDAAMRAHHRLWNYGRVPVLIATTPDEVLALSCNIAQTRQRPDAPVLVEASRQEQLTRVLDDFTRFSVESGRLSHRHSRQLDIQNRVDQTLLRSLRGLRTRLIAAGVQADDVEPLLGRSIFIRYLEDRQILRKKDLRELGQPDSLSDALTEGWNAVSSFFAAMAAHFSGDVFRVDALPRPIPDRALLELAHFFHGADPDTGQVPLWPYNFAIIPPEYISTIYEQLLAPQQKQDAAYYTPRRVVDLVLDEVLPPGAASIPTVLDPACGSGIFLTEAFRRLVQNRKAVATAPLTYSDLSDLLIRSIFGIDQSADAVGVTAFGLYLALLEHVDPRTVWREVRLPDLLGKNLIVSDFFADHALASRNFDVIAGNPPWKSKLTEPAMNYLRHSGHRTPDKQIAVPFIWRSVEMLSPDGVVGMVLPSKTLLHNRGPAAARFRHEFFSALDVRTLIDLSPLRKELFGAASPAVVAVFGANPGRADSHVLHVSPRRTPISGIVDGIVIPQQNIQRVPRSRTLVDSSIWKTLLWGGLADVALITHLRESFPPLARVAGARGWSDGAGYQDVRGGDSNDASHLHHLPQIETKSLHGMRPPDALLPPLTEPTLHRPRSAAIYRAPHVLMRKGFRVQPEAAYVPYDAAFTDGLSALAAPARDERELKAVAGVLSSSVAVYWYLLTASSWGVEREQLHHNEWLSIPIPELSDRQVSELAGLVDRANKGTPESAWRKALDDVVARAYGLTAAERQLISDSLRIRLSELQLGPRSPAYTPPNVDELDDYARALELHLDRLDLGKWDVAITERREGFARITATHLMDKPASITGRFTVESLLHSEGTPLDEWLSSVTIVEPQAVILDGDRVHVVKPDRRSCWTISSAGHDAADIFAALASDLDTPHV